MTYAEAFYGLLNPAWIAEFHPHPLMQTFCVIWREKIQQEPRIIILFQHSHINNNWESSLVVQWLRLCTSTARGTGLIPGPGIKVINIIIDKNQYNHTQTLKSVWLAEGDCKERLRCNKYFWIACARHHVRCLCKCYWISTPVLWDSYLGEEETKAQGD